VQFGTYRARYTTYSGRHGLSMSPTGGPERRGDPIFSGELYALHVLAACQHQGLGHVG